MKLRLLALGALFAASTASFAATNLVTNGSFETGGFDGWSISTDIELSRVIHDDPVVPFNPWPPKNIAPTDGDWQAVLSFQVFERPPGGIFQSIETVPGNSYTLTFDLAVYNIQSLQVGFCGQTLLYAGGSNIDYSPFSYTVAATGISCELDISFWAFPGKAYLDNITVSDVGVIVPEPSSWALMTTSFGLVLAAVRPRRRARSGLSQGRDAKGPS